MKNEFIIKHIRTSKSYFYILYKAQNKNGFQKAVYIRN